MNKLYSVHDHWTDIAKKNDVDIESIDGVITGIKVNGEDYGGGESDFIICVDSESDTLQIFLNDITELKSPDISMSAGTAQVFTEPVYFVGKNDPDYTQDVKYGEIINMGHVLGNTDYPEYFKVQGDLFISVSVK